MTVEELRDKYRSALVFSGIGDALGWPMEFGHRQQIKEFESWKKIVGGKYWGYEQIVDPGMYSDDMQLILSTARCIDESGKFDPSAFSYLELPLWLAYEQGGGKATKLAAHALASGKEWFLNFYSRKDKKSTTSYVDSGGNGALMRTLPLILVNWDNQENLLKEVWKNSIITHGHPRALIASFAYSLTAKVILEGKRNFSDVKKEVINVLAAEKPGRIWGENKKYLDWIKQWESITSKKFDDIWTQTLDELNYFLSCFNRYISANDNDVYQEVGAFKPETKGSGIGTFIISLYMFLKYAKNPQYGLLKIVNMVGSDTDTIANITCGLWGLLHGKSILPIELYEKLQDRDYIESVADSLINIYTRNISENIIKKSFSKKDALLSVLAWEIGLHDMFWDALDEGKKITHPVLGIGTITNKLMKSIPREGYQAKLIRVEFVIGQSCWFHSLVKDDGVIDTSLQKELKQALKSLGVNRIDNVNTI